MDAASLELLRALSDAVAAVEDELIGGEDDELATVRRVDDVVAAGLAVAELVDRGTAASPYAEGIGAASVARLASLAAAAADATRPYIAWSVARVVLRIAAGDPHRQWTRSDSDAVPRPLLGDAIDAARDDLERVLLPDAAKDLRRLFGAFFPGLNLKEQSDRLSRD